MTWQGEKQGAIVKVIHDRFKAVDCSAQEGIPRRLPAEALNLWPRLPGGADVAHGLHHCLWGGLCDQRRGSVKGVDPHDLSKSVNNQPDTLQIS